MHSGCAARFDLRKRLFLDRCHDNVEALATRGIENQEWKLAVAGDKPQFWASAGRVWHVCVHYRRQFAQSNVGLLLASFSFSSQTYTTSAMRTAVEIAEQIGARVVGDGRVELTGIASISNAVDGDLV